MIPLSLYQSFLCYRYSGLDANWSLPLSRPDAAFGRASPPSGPWFPPAGTSFYSFRLPLPPSHSGRKMPFWPNLLSSSRSILAAGFPLTHCLGSTGSFIRSRIRLVLVGFLFQDIDILFPHPFGCLRLDLILCSKVTPTPETTALVPFAVSLHCRAPPRESTFKYCSQSRQR